LISCCCNFSQNLKLVEINWIPLIGYPITRIPGIFGNAWFQEFSVTYILCIILLLLSNTINIIVSEVMKFYQIWQLLKTIVLVKYSLYNYSSDKILLSFGKYWVYLVILKITFDCKLCKTLFVSHNFWKNVLSIKVGGVGGCAQSYFFRNQNKTHFFVRLANINKQFVHHFKIN